MEIPDGEVRPARHPEGGGHYTDDAPPRSTVEVWEEVPIALEGASNRYSVVQLAGDERRSREGHESPDDRPVTRGPPLFCPS